MSLPEYLDMVEKRYEQETSGPVREYWRLTVGEVCSTGNPLGGRTMAELVDVAEQDIKTLTEIGKEVLPAARRVLNNRDYQEAAEKAAPVVKNLVAGLLAESKSGVDTLQNIPVALQKKIDAMRAVTADTFRRDNPRARARADWLDLWPLLNRGEPLRGLPERIAKLEKEIAEAVVVWAGRETAGAGHRLPVRTGGAILRDDREPVVVNPDFDPRFS